MDKGQTAQVVWGNTLILSPSGDNIKATTVSYDLFKTLGDALIQTWDPKTVFPTKSFDPLNKIQLNRPGTVIYRVVKVISAP